MYLSIEEIIAQNPVNIDNLTDPLLDEMNSYGMPSLPSLNIEEYFNPGDCDRWNEFNMKSFVGGIKIQAKQKWDDAKTQAKELAKQTLDNLTNLAKDIWDTIKKIVIDLYKEIIKTYKAVIEYFKAEYRRIIILWKRLKNATSKENRDNIKKQILDLLKKFGNDVLEMFGIYIIIDFIKSLWGVMKNLWGMGKAAWKNAISKFKAADEMLNSDELKKSVRLQGFIEIITTLIPLIASLGAAALAMAACAKKQQQVDEKDVNDAISNYEKEDRLEKYIQYSDLSELISNSELPKNDITENDNNVKKINHKCCLCPVPDNTIVPDVIYPEGYIVEMATYINSDNSINDASVISKEESFKSRYTITAQADTSLNIGDIIGYIDNIPIESEIEGYIIEKTDRHLIVNKPKEETEEDIMNRIKSRENIDFDAIKEDDSTYQNVNSIIDSLNDMIYIEDVFRNRGNILATAMINGCASYSESLPIDGPKNSLYDQTNIIDSNITNIIETFQNDIKKLTNPDKTQEELKNENYKYLESIKTAMFNLKMQLVKDIYDILKTVTKDRVKFTLPLNTNECEITSRMLEFVTTVVPDKDNKYDTELYSIIVEFFVKRFTYEGRNKNILIELLNKNLKQFKKTYNQVYNELNLSKIDVDEYFETLCGLTKESKPVQTDIEVSAEKNLIESEDENGNKIKVIAKTSEDDKNALNANTNNIKEFNKIKELAASLSRIYKLILKVSQIQKTSITYKSNYVTEQSEAEYAVIISYIEKLYSTYISVSSGLDEKINSIKKIGWPAPVDIELNGKRYKHYLFRDNNETENNSIQSISPELEDAYNDIFSSKTRYNMNSYMYWLVYCANATLVNCMLPMYWGTGLVIAGAPISLPIILVPIYYVPGKVGMLLGLGICGIAIWPMLLFVNTTSEDMSVMIPINLIIDMLKELLNKVKDLQLKSLSAMITGMMIEPINERINTITEEIKKIDREILLAKSL